MLSHQRLQVTACIKLQSQHVHAGIDGTAEARTWLLPLMRRHIRGCALAFWWREFMPLAKALGGRAASAGAAGQRLLAQNCHTLELQIWATLPAFCSWASDTVTAYGPAAKDLAAAFTNRSDLRTPVCIALQRLCQQNLQVSTQEKHHAFQLLGQAEHRVVEGKCSSQLSWSKLTIAMLLTCHLNHTTILTIV